MSKQIIKQGGKAAFVVIPIEEWRRIETMLERGFLRVRVRIPYEHTALVDLFHRKGTVATERHTDKGTLITGSLPARFAAPFRRYAVR